MIQELPDLRKVVVTPNDRVILLHDYQDDFIFSKSRYPAMVAAWGTGKSMCLIEKGRIASERYKNNLGLIVRREFNDLQDSTMKDWYENTGIPINSRRESVFPGTKSIVMFRHAEELTKNNLSNMNLGWFGMEQAEEFESDDPFFMLQGRLRRRGVDHFGGVIANTRGRNWIYRLWKAKQLSGYELIEADSFRNRQNIPAQTLVDWDHLKELKPKIYRRFVMNSWEEDNLTEACISPEHIEAARWRVIPWQRPLFRIIGIDVARGGMDKTVMYALENTKILGRLVLERKDSMEVVGHALQFAADHKSIQDFAIDELDSGSGVVDRLKEMRKNVIAVDSRKRSSDPKRYRNVRAEVYGHGSQLFENGLAELDGEKYPELCEQLSWAKWKHLDSSMMLQVEDKDLIRKTYGASPDDADAYLYGRWGMQSIYPVREDEYNPRTKGYVHPRHRSKKQPELASAYF